MTSALILTTLNNGKTIEAFIASVQRQTRKPDEVLVLDAGSTDGTREKMRAVGWQVWVNQYCTIQHSSSPVARGRNKVAWASKQDVLLFTNADCELAPDWVERMMAAIEAGAVSVYGDVLPIVATWKDFAIGEATLPNDSEPTARCLAVRRREFQRVGGFPEITLTGEDTAFVRLLVPPPVHTKATVYWRPRSTIRAVMRQGYRYAKGDAISGLNARMYGKLIGKYALGVLPLILLPNVGTLCLLLFCYGLWSNLRGIPAGWLDGWWDLSKKRGG